MKHVDKSDIGDSFFRGENGVQFNPYKGDFRNPIFLQEFILKGWIPEKYFIQTHTNITAFGSCFVGHIIRMLQTNNFKLTTDSAPEIHISNMGEGLANVKSIYQQFEWVLENKPIPEGLWYGANVEEYGIDENIRLKTKELFLNTEVFVFSIGLSEVWEEIESGETFWKAVPTYRYDPAKHRFRILSLTETKDTFLKLYNIIKKYIPNCKVIFTVSPTPMAATFRDMSCVTANLTSKAIIKASLDEFMRENTDTMNSLFYFPSYEIVNLFFDKFLNDNRHIKDEIIKLVMRVFEILYCDTNIGWEYVEDLFKKELENNRLTKFI